MPKHIITFLFLVLLLLCANAGYCNETEEASLQSVASTVENAPQMPVKAIPPSVAVAKIVRLLTSWHDAVGQVIVPLSSTMFALISIALIVGIFFGVKFIRTVGLIGLLCCALGLGLYVATPFLVGIITGVGASLNK